MQANGGGSIINIASILGLRVSQQVPAYVAAKAALIHLTAALALEWARYGIRVNALAPGYIETDMNRAFFETEGGQANIRRIPQRRLGQPRHLDGALLLRAAKVHRHHQHRHPRARRCQSRRGQREARSAGSRPNPRAASPEPDLKPPSLQATSLQATSLQA